MFDWRNRLDQSGGFLKLGALGADKKYHTNREVCEVNAVQRY